MTVKLTLEQKFTYLLAKKLKGKDVKQEMNTLTEKELLEFKKWVAKKKESAEFEIWKKRTQLRAEEAEKKLK
jgi:hypothetical protein